MNSNKFQHNEICKLLSLDKDDLKDMYIYGLTKLYTENFEVRLELIGTEYLFIVTENKLSKSDKPELLINHRGAYIFKRSEIKDLKDELMQKYISKK
jgi:hypothetical protein